MTGSSHSGRDGHDDKATSELVDGLIDAFHQWDDPARVAARAALAEQKEWGIQQILELSYIQSGQRGSTPMDVAIRQMRDYFAGRIAAEASPVGPLPRLHQPLPEIDNGG